MIQVKVSGWLGCCRAGASVSSRGENRVGRGVDVVWAWQKGHPQMNQRCNYGCPFGHAHTTPTRGRGGAEKSGIPNSDKPQCILCNTRDNTHALPQRRDAAGWHRCAGQAGLGLHSLGSHEGT
jgi:hypothetical protein